MEVMFVLFTEKQAWKAEVNSEEDMECLKKCIISAIKLYDVLRTE